MSEQKRATLSTISTPKGETKKVKEKPKTIRFSLTLPESNEKSCPEYNYKDLLNSAEKKNKKIQNHVNGNLNNVDCLDEDDSDVKRIAQKFEAKYGGVPTKRSMGKIDDYADIGAGYDESDSFIDNTDAYDEVVPEGLTTAFGGFYINSGALEFKNADISASKKSDSEGSVKVTTSRKRIIEDTDESESEDEEKEKDPKKEEVKTEHIDKKQRIETNGIQKQVVKKKLVLTDEQELVKKKKVEESALKKKSATVKSLLREKREEFDMTIELESPTKDKPSSVNDVIESVVNAARKLPKDETSKDSLGSEVPIRSPASSDSESSREAAPAPIIEQAAVELPRQKPDVPSVNLPENVPNSIFEIINSIKKAVENVFEEKDIFSDSVNSMLVSLETNCRKLVKPDRLQIYEHLAPFVKCTKGSLMRRAKVALLRHENRKLEETLFRLRIIVDTCMPDVKKIYEQECQKVRDEMFLANAKANSENGDINAAKRLHKPRKKFPWIEDARRTLQEIIAIQRRCFALAGNQKESFEDNFELFLKSTLYPIWPDGWISIAALKKQVRIISENNQIKKELQKPLKVLAPISLDIGAATTISPVTPYVLSPVKNISPNTASAITVIPIPPSSVSTVLNGPKLKSDIKHHSPTIKPSMSEINVTVNKKHSESNVISTSAEISAVHRPKETTPVSSSLLIPSSNKSMTITSVDLRTNSTKKEEESSSALALSNNNTNDHITMTPSIPPPLTAKPINLNSRILSEHLPKTPALKVDVNDDCQIIDLTDTTPANIIRKPGPKSKTRYVDGTVKVKKVKEPIKIDDHRKPDAISGTHALNQIITGLKYGENPSSTTANEDDMEQVMKDLKELQQLQEHRKKHDLAVDLMSPSCSPVSVIAYNSSYSPNSKMQANDLTTSSSKEKKISPDNPGFQEIFRKHLFQENTLLTSSQSSSVYSNANVQPKSNYNSANNFSYSAGSIPNTMNNIRYPQSSSKYTSAMNHLPTNPTGSTNHTDDFALLHNFLYQYGYHNNSGSKQKSPP